MMQFFNRVRYVAGDCNNPLTKAWICTSLICMTLSGLSAAITWGLGANQHKNTFDTLPSNPHKPKIDTAFDMSVILFFTALGLCICITICPSIMRRNSRLRGGEGLDTGREHTALLYN